MISVYIILISIINSIFTAPTNILNKDFWAEGILPHHPRIERPPEHLIKRSLRPSSSEVSEVSSDIWLFLISPEFTLEDFRNQANTTGVKYYERLNFKDTLLHGLSIYIPLSDSNKKQDAATSISILASLPSVETIWPSIRFSQKKELEKAALLEIDIAHLGDYVEFPAMASKTGVAQVHEQLHVFGTGIKVGVIDSGVDYTHPALGGCFGEDNCKVRYGYDFVGDGSNGFLQPDDDPMDCAGHGTHVAGIIAANSSTSSLIGVAPNVTLGAYRVFGCDGTADSDVIIASLEMAYRDGMDIINMSLGQGPGWPEHPVAVVVNRLAALGILVSVAAGNAGDQGLYMVEVPSVAPLATSVASLENDWILSRAFNVTTNNVDTEPRSIMVTAASEASYGQASSLNGRQLILASVYSANQLPQADACFELPESIDYKEKIVLIRRGECTFAQKALKVQDHGAFAAIIYDNENSSSPFMPGFSDDFIRLPVMGISKADGEWLVNQLVNKTWPLSLDWFDTYQSFRNPEGGLLSRFSSMGLASNMEIKPDIVAPGGSIVSTYPVSLGSYSSISGTSMAAPYITGCYALLLEKVPIKSFVRKESIADFALALLQNGATPVQHGGYDSETKEFAESPVRQGAGLVNIYQSITQNWVVYPSKLAFNNLKLHVSGNESYSVKTNVLIANFDSVEREYHFSNVQTLITNSSNVFDPAFVSPVTVNDSSLQVHFKPSAINVTSYNTSFVEVVISLNSSTFSDHEELLLGGFITVENIGRNETTFVPYTAFKGNLNQIPILDVTPDPMFGNQTFPQLYSIKSNETFSSPLLHETLAPNDITPVATFSLTSLSSDASVMLFHDAPIIRIRIQYGSPLVIMSILDPNRGTLVGDITTDTYLGRNSNDPTTAPIMYQYQWLGKVNSPTMGLHSSGRYPIFKEKSVRRKLWERSARKGVASVYQKVDTILSSTFSSRRPSLSHSTWMKSSSALSQSRVPSFEVADGVYVIQVKVYRPLGSSLDYEMWLSPPFEIKRR